MDNLNSPITIKETVLILRPPSPISRPRWFHRKILQNKELTPILYNPPQNRRGNISKFI